MTKKYTSPMTAKLTPSNWQEQLNPNMLSLDDVLDLLGDFKEMVKFAGQMEGYLKEALKGKMPPDTNEYHSSNFRAVINHRVRSGGFDTGRMKEDMGEAWLGKYEKPRVEYDEIRVTRVEEGEDVA